MTLWQVILLPNIHSYSSFVWNNPMCQLRNYISEALLQGWGVGVSVTVLSNEDTHVYWMEFPEKELSCPFSLPLAQNVNRTPRSGGGEKSYGHEDKTHLLMLVQQKARGSVGPGWHQPSTASPCISCCVRKNMSLISMITNCLIFYLSSPQQVHLRWRNL